MLSALVLITGIVTKDQLINAIEYDLKPTIAGKNKKLIEHVSILLGSDKNGQA